ncbi:hypothetical protein NC653_004764 [Populus alba x Populus x berolinensis]|uniref:Uncharacterized protein n=1 Tax=Populus alba x Populus x berolinensis TaxID=444605 RepID=A0AAD6WJP6_9ROSI|nr:hypothetical protein NC653_004764 [Populus alba x Populus x berolinensis]
MGAQFHNSRTSSLKGRIPKLLLALTVLSLPQCVYIAYLSLPSANLVINSVQEIGPTNSRSGNYQAIQTVKMATIMTLLLSFSQQMMMPTFPPHHPFWAQIMAVLFGIAMGSYTKIDQGALLLFLVRSLPHGWIDEDSSFVELKRYPGLWKVLENTTHNGFPVCRRRCSATHGAGHWANIETTWPDPESSPSSSAEEKVGSCQRKRRTEEWEGQGGTSPYGLILPKYQAAGVTSSGWDTDQLDRNNGTMKFLSILSLDFHKHHFSFLFTEEDKRPDESGKERVIRCYERRNEGTAK